MVISSFARANLPSDIDGKMFLFQVANIKNGNNPNTNQIYIMHFAKDTYNYEVVSMQKVVQGHYTYQILDPKNEIGLISCHETENGQTTDYTLLLNAENEKTGLYIYKQAHGKILPEQRLNFSYYTILDKF